MNIKERLKRSFEKLFVDTSWGEHLPNRDDKFEVRMFVANNVLTFLVMPLSIILMIALFSQYLKPRAAFLYFIIYSLIRLIMGIAYASYRKELVWVFIELILLISLLIVGYIFYPLLPEEL